MVGNIKINLWLGLIGFFITFFASIENNLWTTSLFRGVLGFSLWFFLAFVLRFVLGILANPSSAATNKPSTPTSSENGQPDSSVDDPSRGGQFDVVTPDQDQELSDLLTPRPTDTVDKGGFAPLNPPKLVSNKQQDPEEMAKAVRHLTQK